MSNYTLHIKGMVCPRCTTAVENTLKKFNIDFLSVTLGEVRLNKYIDTEIALQLKIAIEELGFEILNTRKAQLIEKIKNTVVNMVHYQTIPEKIGHLSYRLPKELGYSYSFLSKLFSEVEGITIEKYLINQKIEKAKELLVYEELNIGEIAYRLNYSSSQHFSRQFKTITGFSPSAFNRNKKGKRKPINEI